jgi:hypothetical protein
MTENFIKIFLSLSIIFYLSIFSCQKNNINKISFESANQDLILVDTLLIKEAVIVDIEDHTGILHALISERDIEFIEDLGNNKEIILKKGYFFYPLDKFSCLLNNIDPPYINDENPLNLSRSQINEFEKLNIWENVEQIKKEENRNYYKIDKDNFLFFLVKGSLLNLCQGRGEVGFEDFDNIYFKVLVPLTW